MSIRLRLTVWYSALLAFTLFLFGISIYTFVDYKIYGDIKQRISDTVNQITILPTLDFQNGLDFDVTPRDANRLVNEALFTQLTNYTNGSVKQSDEMIASRIELKPPKSPRDIRDGYRTVDIRGNEFLIYEQAITIKSQIVGAIQVLSYTGQEARFFRELRSILIISSMVTVVLAFSLGLFLAQKSLRPIENVIKATNRIQKGTDLSMRIPREGAPEDEIGQLTETINSMLGRMETFYNELDEAYRAQRRFVSDASHELRTPLTTIRGNVDLLEKMWVNQSQATPLSAQEREVMSLEALSDIADESRRMTRLVNDLLSLARADAGYTMEKQYLELKPLLDDVVRRAQFLPRKADWVIEEEAGLKEVAVYGNKDYLQQMLFIFIENAFKYTESGSVILSAVILDRQVGIKIKDTGIGMNEKEVPYIFERFYRADVSRGVTSGTGLGLSIAKWIIDEHKGSVEVVTKPGEGTTFLIWLPLAVVDVDKVDPV
ncbi:HAMP domain-containing histidine kinase [Paenibacillus sp. ACRRX]|uniref:sensor histidine kinase n=1 Tax=unclassified Paenibacillus TaxID=185978 RepID=UPI001EF4D0E5|nr:MULTISPECIES: HAMP domain-containing sensor histidine kinase [unclassified Paenibacillus]MCG7409814.1 HAMP domain-containing histidine kinase [Paenibacillus sp. ACRRX]MDK8183118.1 HAMP domain-containing sensor histidine kinase [Paenibacillus sp. UMB4589-SE434]